MVEIEKLFETMTCGRCLTSKAKAKVFLSKCRHFLCSHCDKKLTHSRTSMEFYKCVICSHKTRRFVLSDICRSISDQKQNLEKVTQEKDDLRTLDTKRQATEKELKKVIGVFSINMFKMKGESDVEKQFLANENAKLLNENVTLKQKQRILEEKQEDHHKCVECGSKDSEQNLQLCATCHTLKFEDSENVKENALCSTCAIKKHIRLGHDIVDFFTYLSAVQFKDKTMTIKPKCEEFKNSHKICKEASSKFNLMLNDVKNHYDELADIARRSRSTKSQTMVFEKIESFLTSLKTVSENMTIDVKKHTEIMERYFVELEDWCDNQEGECYAESETINLP